MPILPFGKKKFRQPPFYALDAELPLVLAIASGLQHALAMLAGLITPPIIFASALSLDIATSAHMISASLIGCGDTCSHSTLVSETDTMYPRNSEFHPDVENQAFQGILFGYRVDQRRGDKFFDAEHHERSG
jgi:hypothetical protein